VLCDGGIKLFLFSEIWKKGESAVHEHDCSHILDAVITISEVIHRLELLVNDSDTSFVCAASDFLDIGKRKRND